MLIFINSITTIAHHALELIDMVRAVCSFGKRIFPGNMVSRVILKVGGDMAKISGLSEEDYQC